MSDDHFRYAFSHLLVAGTTVWCMYNFHTPDTWQWINGTYIPICLYSLTGVWRYGNPKYGENAAHFYCFTYELVQMAAGPSFVADLYLHYGYDPQYALIHAAIPAIPIGIKLLKHEFDQDLIDTILLGCLISGTTVSIIQDSYYGIAANVSFLINHFILRRRALEEVPTLVMYNVGLCFFLFYSYKALAEARVAVH